MENKNASWKVWKKKPVAIFLIAVLLILFAGYVVKMVGDLPGGSESVEDTSEGMSQMENAVTEENSEESQKGDVMVKLETNKGEKLLTLYSESKSKLRDAVKYLKHFEPFIIK